MTSQPHSRTADVDVITHGAVFISPGLGHSENFEFEITDELSGIEIPYHVHPGDQEGVISVSAETTDHGEDQSIMIMEDQLMPAKLAVNVGDTVVWSESRIPKRRDHERPLVIHDIRDDVDARCRDTACNRRSDAHDRPRQWSRFHVAGRIDPHLH